MQEQANFPSIWALSGKPQPRQNAPHTPPWQMPRPFVDIQCLYCKGWGHKRVNCDRMAQYVLMQEAYKTLDKKKKATLVETYMKAQNERTHRRIVRGSGHTMG
jgi:hypothetical protein